MSLRNKINENPAIPVIGVLIALAVCGYFLWGLIMAPKVGDIGSDWVAFYSIDDGQTFFADKTPPSKPFKKDGKDAYLALVYTCDNNKTTFCNALIKRESVPLKMKNAPAGAVMTVNYIKKPGDTEWIPDTSFGKWSAIERAPKCPDGSQAIGVTPAGMRTGDVAKQPAKKK